LKTSSRHMKRLTAVTLLLTLLTSTQACSADRHTQPSPPVGSETKTATEAAQAEGDDDAAADAPSISIDPSLVAVCGSLFETSVRAIEAGERREGLSLALQALSECPVFSPEVRAKAKECAPLVAERRSVRLMEVLNEECAPKSPFDLATVLSPECAPKEVSDALLRVVDAPTAAFAAQVERRLEVSQVPHRQRLLAHLLLGAAAEGEALGR
jgi:hypothetical protein